MVKIHQHVKFQAIPSMHSPANARKPLRTDDRTCRKTVTVGRVDQRTHVQVKRGYFRLRTDGRTDGQPENIMPPAPKGGGIKTYSTSGNLLQSPATLWQAARRACNCETRLFHLSILPTSLMCHEGVWSYQQKVLKSIYNITHCKLLYPTSKSTYTSLSRNYLVTSET